MTSRLVLGALLVVSGATQAQPVVPWSAETVRVPSFTAGDLALVVDVGPDAGAPFIIGTDPKTSGSYVYDLNGKQLQVLVMGRVGGVDTRSRLSVQDGRTLSTLSAFTTGVLPTVRAEPDGGFAVINQTLFASPGALALTRTPSGGLEAWVASNAVADTRAHHLRYVDAGFVEFDTVTLTALPSSLVVDDRWGRLFIASPAEGVFTLEPNGTFGRIVDLTDFASVAISGLALYPLNDGGTLLLTTVPSADQVAVHNVSIIGSPVFLGTFRVGPPDGGAQRVRGSVALDLTSRAIPGYDAGLLVLHDNANANYKLVAWPDIANAFSPPLPIELPNDDAGFFRDAGADAGAKDGGLADGGIDAGADAGVRDAGTGGGGGGGSRGGGAGTGGGTARGGGTGAGGGGDDQPTGCGCASVEPLLPLLMGAWVWRRRRRVG